MLVYILIAVAAGLAGFLAFVAMQPAEFCVSRSASIVAPVAKVFSQVNDLRQMNAWSPWLEPDPQVKLTYEGPAAGTGALFSWDGNKQVGAGRLTIVDSRPYDCIRIQLDFFRPFASIADTEFTFKTEGDRTVVTWTMRGRKIFMTKLIGLFLSMDKMIGGNFAKGLATMKSRVENTPHPTEVQS